MIRLTGPDRTKLPIEYGWQKALSIYGYRLALFLVFGLIGILPVLFVKLLSTEGSMRVLLVMVVVTIITATAFLWIFPRLKGYFWGFTYLTFECAFVAFLYVALHFIEGLLFGNPTDGSGLARLFNYFAKGLFVFSVLRLLFITLNIQGRSHLVLPYQQTTSTRRDKAKPERDRTKVKTDTGIRFDSTYKDEILADDRQEPENQDIDNHVMRT